MQDLYQSKYYSHFRNFLDKGWTKQEINIYFPILENMNATDLLELHSLCRIKMYSTPKEVDEEQAIHVLVNTHDTPKELLISAIKKLKGL